MADTISRLLDDLCRSGASDRRKDGEHAMLEYVEMEARDLSADAFARFMNDILGRIQSMLSKR